MTPHEEQEAKHWLDVAPKQDLQSILLNYADADHILFYELRNRFSDRWNEQSLAKMQTDIQKMIAKNTHNGSINDLDGIAICNTLDHITQGAIDTEFDWDLSFAVQKVLFVVRSAMKIIDKVTDDLPEPTITLFSAFKALDQLSEKMAPALFDSKKDKLIASAIDVFNLQAFNKRNTYRYAVLEHVMPLMTEDSFKLVEQAAAEIPERYSGYDKKDPHKSSVLHDVKVHNINLKIQGLIALGQVEAAKKLMAENKHFKLVRQTAIQFYLSQNDLKNAEKLAIEGTLDKSEEADPERWLNDLEKIYLERKSYLKLSGVYKSRFLLLSTSHSTDFDDYGKLKALLQKHNKWEQKYPKLLREFSKKLAPVNYGDLLEFENETAKLMALVEKRPDLIFYYGKTLYGDFPDKVTTFYRKTLIDTFLGTTRDQYKQLGDVIRRYSDYGDKNTARQWCQQLMTQHAKNSAFVNEMKKVRDSIH
jgi:hypothetical protein